MVGLVPLTLNKALGVSPKPVVLLLCTVYEELTYFIKELTSLLAVTSADFLPGDTPLPSTAHDGAVPQIGFFKICL